MIRSGAAFGLALVCLVGPGISVAAPSIEIEPELRAAIPRDRGLEPGARTSDNRIPPVVRAGNPLWAVPLSSLSATRERPVFSSSRRPPAPAVPARPLVRSAPPPAPAPRQPERPQLALVGTVAGDAEGIAVFVDQTTQMIVRLRTGEGHAGWILRSVGGREVTLQSEQNTAILALPANATK
jgi:hypothetical protein